MAGPEVTGDEARPAARMSDAEAALFREQGYDPAALIATPEVARRAGLTYRQVDHAARTGVLRPVHVGGSGYSRWFTPEEAAVARGMGRLVAAGFPLGWSAQFARSGQPSAELAPGITVTVEES